MATRHEQHDAAARDTRALVKQLTDEGYSITEIAEILEVTTTLVQRARNTTDGDAPVPGSRQAKCPDCGAFVYVPCIACWTRRRRTATAALAELADLLHVSPTTTPTA